MRPLSEPEYDDWDEDALPVLPVRTKMQLWVRVGLLVIALGITLVFGIAVYLDPYRENRVWTQETHTQLGLPPCSFKVVTGVPCPSCGMTTSFALFIRGDLWDSVCANFAGTFLALWCFLYVPWAAASVWRGKFLWIVSLENVFIRLLLSFLTLMLGRWVILLFLRVVFGLI